MLKKLLAAGTIAAIVVAAALAADTPKFQLRGDRFKPLTYEEMTPEQRTLIDHLLSGPRGSVNGPFNAMLRSPELGDLQQAIGAYVRFRTSIPHKLNELAILMTGRHWNAQYEWYAHKRIALEAGLSPAVIADIAAGKRPANMPPDEEIVYNFTRELNDTKQVSDATFKAAVEKFGERGVVDLVGTVGYYHLVSMLLNLDRYPLPDGAQPELQALK
ncbi:MAG TPA: carboxymuconolactone decarboxylase family protein [Xanthobacteraceae bacterium]|nr:carboxymuconolactone decarboxylase family protein [Xanthobacteraceae bacterium]